MIANDTLPAGSHEPEEFARAHVTDVPPAITDPGRQEPNHLGSPVDIVAAILGSGSIRLRGFSAQPAMPNWLRPGMQFVSASISVQGLDEAFAANRRRQKMLLAATLIATHVAAIGATFFIVQELMRGPAAMLAAAGSAAPHGAPTVAWRAVAVNDSAVTIRVAGSTEPVFIRIPVGGRLPNGETIQSTSQDSSQYTTESGTTALRTASAAAATATGGNR